MIPPMPKMAAAIPPTTAPVETFAPELEEFPLFPVAEGVGVREVSEVRVYEVDVDVGVERMGVLINLDSAQVSDEADGKTNRSRDRGGHCWHERSDCRGA